MIRPPRIPRAFIRFFAGKGIAEELEGDLYEDFLDHIDLYGIRKARSIYTWTALQSIRPYLFVHNQENRKPKLTDMVAYHFKMALRNMGKNKVYTGINIFGLCTGLACSLAIFLFIIDQSLMDGFQVNQDRIYRLEAEYDRNGTMTRSVSMHGSTMSAIADDIPGIEAYARISKSTRTVLLKQGDSQSLVEETFLFTDSDFFKVFSFEILSGIKQDMLADPTAVVITESAALRHFGQEDPLGQVIEFASEYDKPKKVVAVVADPVGDSSIEFDFIAPNVELFPPGKEYSFNARFAISLPVYLLLGPDVDPAAVAARVAPELKKHTDKKRIIESSYSLRAFDAVKYDMDVSDNIIQPVDKRVIYMFVIIAVFIISLAVINYVNISTARAIHRAQEVGIRKVVGASRKNLFGQFIMESLSICFISLFLALLLLEVVVPYFELILERQLFFDYWSSTPFLLGLILFVFVLAISAGLYPALMLSRFRFVQFMKGQSVSGRKGSTIRRMLVVFQFTFSIALIIGALLVQDQLSFIKEKTLSYSPEHMVVVKGKFGAFSKNYKTVKGAIAQLPGVSAVSVANSSPGDERFMNGSRKDIAEPFARYIVDEDYLDIFNLRMIKGEAFNPNADSAGIQVIVNESLAALLEVEEPLYSTAYKFYGRNNNKIVGVVEDFYFESLHNEIRPVLITPAASMAPALSQYIVKVNAERFESTIEGLESIWEEFYPEAIFDYEFLDDKLDRMYTAEYRLSRVFDLFTVLAVLISCLGLLGLSTHMAETRMKEVSVRKVLGASLGQLIGLLSRQVYVSIALAAIIATPLAYYLVEQWLQDFAYSVRISSQVFIVTILACLALAALTTAWHTLKTARANPAESLRNE